MQKQEQNSEKTDKVNQLHKKYNTISYELRKTLIQMVQQQKISVYQTSKILNIKNSTAKAIVRKYRRQGRIFKRKRETVIGERKIEQNIPRMNEDQSEEEYKEQIIGSLVNDAKPFQQSGRSQFESFKPSNSQQFYFFPYVWAQLDHCYMI